MFRALFADLASRSGRRAYFVIADLAGAPLESRILLESRKSDGEREREMDEDGILFTGVRVTRRDDLSSSPALSTPFHLSSPLSQIQSFDRSA